MKRGGWIKRFSRLRAKGGPRFKAGRDEAWCEHIRGLPCVLAGSPHTECEGRTECAHVRSKGAGGPDRGNTVPLCTKHHSAQHHMGIRSFQVLFAVDLGAIARELSDKETW